MEEIALCTGKKQSYWFNIASHLRFSTEQKNVNCEEINVLHEIQRRDVVRDMDKRLFLLNVN